MDPVGLHQAGILGITGHEKIDERQLMTPGRFFVKPMELFRVTLAIVSRNTHAEQGDTGPGIPAELNHGIEITLDDLQRGRAALR